MATVDYCKECGTTIPHDRDFCDECEGIMAIHIEDPEDWYDPWDEDWDEDQDEDEEEEYA